MTDQIADWANKMCYPMLWYYKCVVPGGTKTVRTINSMLRVSLVDNASLMKWTLTDCSHCTAWYRLAWLLTRNAKIGHASLGYCFPVIGISFPGIKCIARMAKDE
jgi:hypothetical protein